MPKIVSKESATAPFVVDLSETPMNSRSSSATRARGGISKRYGKLGSTTKSIRSRSSLRSKATVKDSEDELSDDFEEPSITVTSTKKTTRGHVSMSSVSTMNESATSSGYSTPGTSAVATPAILDNQEIGSSNTRRGRRPTSSLASQLPTSALNAFARAQSLRNSQFGLNPTNTKRKRSSLDEDEEEGEVEEEEEEEEDDDDDTPDAQLARALQEQENSNVDMMAYDSVEEVLPRRGKRALRPLRPKSDYADLSDDDFGSKPTVNPKNSKKAKYTVPDSDESDFVLSSEDEGPLLLNASTRKSKVATVVGSSGIKAEGSTAIKTSLQTGAIANGRSVFGRSSIKGSSVKKEENGIEGKVSTTTAEIDFKREISEGSDLSELSDFDHPLTDTIDSAVDLDSFDTDSGSATPAVRNRRRIIRGESRVDRRARLDRERLEVHHPEILAMWKELETTPHIKKFKAAQPVNITRELKPFQLEGLSWMKEMEKTKWGGGLLGDEMGMGKTIQAVSLIMSDYPARNPSLVLIPPVALMQWQQEIGDYTDGTLKTFVFHGTNARTKGITVKELKKYDVILMSYNSLESMYRFQEKGRKRKDELHFEESVIHQIHFHRVILDEAHNIKTRSTGCAKACFALKAGHKWCLSGTPLQNRIGEFFSLIRFLDIRPFACYMCKQCPCTTLEWSMNADNRCTGCGHSGMSHVSVFNHELLNPIQKHGNKGLGKEAFAKLRLLTDRFMLRRVKRDHSAAMELPAKEIFVDRHFFGEQENDFAASIMNSGNRKFETYVAQGVLLNNYANIFGLIMQMRQVANHPDLILKKNGEGGQNVLVCCVCDETAEDAIRSSCHHEFCRACVRDYLKSSSDASSHPDCPRCHIPLSIDLEQPEIEQNEEHVKKSSIINRIKMENWTSSSKIEALVYDIYGLRSSNSSTKSIVFSGFTTMLQLVEWRLRRAGITTVMLDGSMTPTQRQASINAFMTNPNIECFLVSLKAGGVALNLTEASKVFIVDPWWNPAAEWQSADRCHRIGQSRPCSITRLCIEDSVESRMVLLQEKKTNMINSTINNDESAMESLTPEDMQFLFRGT